jgi:hypothetical protein
VSRERRAVRARAGDRRRTLLIGGGAGALAGLLLVAAGRWILGRRPTQDGGTVHDARTQGEIDLLTPGTTMFVAQESAGALYRFRPVDGVYAERRAGGVYVVVPTPLEPTATRIASSPVELGAARV